MLSDELRKIRRYLDMSLAGGPLGAAEMRCVIANLKCCEGDALALEQSAILPRARRAAARSAKADNVVPFPVVARSEAAS